MSELVIGVIIGAVGASIIVALLAWWQHRQTAIRHFDELAERDDTVLELRQDAAEDKETNRRLRHELAVKTPGHLLETATNAEMERDGALSERDQAIEQLDLVHRDLAAAKTRLTEQDAKLRQYREALQEIRLSLEAQGRERHLEPASGLESELDMTDGELAPTGTNDLTAAESAGVAPEPVDLRAGD